MKLSRVYARFYKSFNYDHHRKAHNEAEARAWEKIGDLWYPYIEVPIDSKITTIVGANESGKSHLLGAIRISNTKTSAAIVISSTSSVVTSFGRIWVSLGLT
jgi:AAA15 family ATPase/GTPase